MLFNGCGSTSRQQLPDAGEHEHDMAYTRQITLPHSRVIKPISINPFHNIVTPKMSTVFQPGNTAVITGGASGIGLALTKRCLSHKMKVLIADWDDQLLAQVCADLTTGDVTTFKMDVGKLEDWEGLKTKVDEVFGGMSTSPSPFVFLYLLLFIPPLRSIVQAAHILQGKQTSSPSTRESAPPPRGRTPPPSRESSPPTSLASSTASRPCCPS